MDDSVEPHKPLCLRFFDRKTPQIVTLAVELCKRISVARPLGVAVEMELLEAWRFGTRRRVVGRKNCLCGL